MDYNKDYKNFMYDRGIGTLRLDQYNNHIMNSMISPNIIEERTGNPMVLDVFSKLQQSRILFLGTQIDSDVANIIMSQLLFLRSEDDESDVKLYINSPGGVIDDGLCIYDTMQLMPFDISTIDTGLAASMASVLLAAGTKGKRFILPHSRVMIHQPMGGTQGQASDIEIAAQEIRKMKTELCGILSDCTGQNLEKIISDCDRDTWFRGQEAVDYGLCDFVMTKNKKG